MKKYILLSLLLLPCFLFAKSEIEVTGQFVIAPISSDKCQAEAITMPTYGLDTEGVLYQGLTYMFPSLETPTEIDEVTNNPSENVHVSAIYSVDGQKKEQLTNGINIVVYDNGECSKILK